MEIVAGSFMTGVMPNGARSDQQDDWELLARGRRDGDAEVCPRTHDRAAHRQCEQRFVLEREARVRGSKDNGNGRQGTGDESGLYG
jgi:hypothetical protein